MEKNPEYKVLDVFKKPFIWDSLHNIQGKSFFLIKDFDENDIENSIQYNNAHRFYFYKKIFRTNGDEIKEWFNKSEINIKPEEKPLLIIKHYITRSKDEYADKIKFNPKPKWNRYSWDFFNRSENHKIEEEPIDYSNFSINFIKSYNIKEFNNDKIKKMFIELIKKSYKLDDTQVENLLQKIEKNCEIILNFNLNNLIGILLVKCYDEFILIDKICIDENYRRKKYGSNLIKNLIDKQKKPIIVFCDKEIEKFFKYNNFITDNDKVNENNYIRMKFNDENNIINDDFINKYVSKNNNKKYENKYIKYKNKYLKLKKQLKK
jgi:hypothetical protein